MNADSSLPPRPPMLDEADRPGPPPRIEAQRSGGSRGLTVLLAMFALAAFGGIVWYAYDQGRRVGSEQAAPLIKADTSPTKIKPQEPGGMKVPHQDMLVLRDLRTGSGGQGKVERLLPPPESPLPPPSAPKPLAVPKPAPKGQARAVVAIPPARRPPAGTTAPPAPSKTATAAAAAAAAATTAPAKSAASTPPRRLPAPVVQPDTRTAPATTSKVKTATTPIVNKTAAAGRFRVQLAAVRNESVAQREWRRLRFAHPAQLGALRLTVERVDLGSGKGVFYRIQGGPLRQAEARRSCAALAARKQACLVVRR